MNSILALTLTSQTAQAILAKPLADSVDFLGAGEASIDPKSIKNGIITDLKSVISASEKAISIAEKAAKTSAKNAIISFSNELVKGNTSSAEYTRQNPDSPIEASEIKDILKAIQEKSRLSVQKLITLETGNKSIELQPLSSAIVDLKIDGHSVSEPVGKTGAKISLLVYTSFTPLLQISDLEKLCSELDLNLLSIIPEPYALARAILKTDENFSGILVDINSDKTNLAVINRGILLGTRTFAVGINQTKKSPDVWFSSLEICLEDLKLPLLPPKIYLSGDITEFETLQETLALSNWSKTLPFKTRPIIDLFPKNAPILFGLLEISLDFQD